MEMLIAVVLALLLAAIVYGTVAKTKWGINPNPPQTCPACGSALAKFPRQPASLAETLWGGKTCGNCGTRIDKWGRQIGGSETRPAS